MYFVSAVLTPEHQASTGPVGLTGMTTAGTGLASVVRVHFHSHRTVQRRFISQEGLQFSKTPLAPTAFVGACFFRSLGVTSPFSTVTDIRQILKPDERMGEATKNALAQLMVPVSDKPSFSPADLNQFSGRGTSAFTLQVSTQAGIVVFPLSGLLTALEERMVAGIGSDSVVTLSHIYTNNPLMVFRFGFSNFYFQ